MADTGPEDAKAAVADAWAAWAGWRQTLAQERGDALRRWGELMGAAAEDLAVLAASESGKPLAEAREEVAYARSFVDLYAAEAPAPPRPAPESGGGRACAARRG